MPPCANKCKSKRARAWLCQGERAVVINCWFMLNLFRGVVDVRPRSRTTSANFNSINGQPPCIIAMPLTRPRILLTRGASAPSLFCPSVFPSSASLWPSTGSSASLWSMRNRADRRISGPRRLFILRRVAETRGYWCLFRSRLPLDSMGCV